MSYSTQADMIAAFGEPEMIQLTDRDHAGVIGAGVLAAAQFDADAEIDQRLRVKGWTLPLTVESADLRKLSQDITRFLLYDEVTPDVVKDGYERALKTLDNYVKGTLILDIGLPTSASASAGDVDFTARERLFTDSTLADF